LIEEKSSPDIICDERVWKIMKLSQGSPYGDIVSSSFQQNYFHEIASHAR